MHRQLALVAVVVALIGLTAAPSAADKPFEFSVTFDIVSINPCTGGPHFITFDFDISEHEHKNNFVGRVSASGTAEPGGYTMKGVNHAVANSNIFVQFFNHVFSNDEGSKYEASGRFKLNRDGSEVELFELRCIGGPTILP